MKKHLIIFSISVFTLCACGGRQLQNQDASSDNVKVVDTIKKIEKSQEKHSDKFLTQDLRMYNFFGRVKSFHTMVYECDANQKYDSNNFADDFLSLEYDENGHFKDKIDSFNELKDVKKRDGEKIIEASYAIEDFDGETIDTKWIYNAQNQVECETESGIEGSCETHYFYNNDGELTKMTSKTFGEGCGYNTTITYIILKRDNFGNWTERFATIDDDMCCWDAQKQDYGAYKKQPIRFEYHIREISYY